MIEHLLYIFLVIITSNISVSWPLGSLTLRLRAATFWWGRLCLQRSPNILKVVSLSLWDQNFHYNFRTPPLRYGGELEILGAGIIMIMIAIIVNLNLDDQIFQNCQLLLTIYRAITFTYPTSMYLAAFSRPLWGFLKEIDIKEQYILKYTSANSMDHYLRIKQIIVSLVHRIVMS